MLSNHQPLKTEYAQYIYMIFTRCRLDQQKNINFWDVTPCSSVDVHRLFGRKYYLHLQGRRVSGTKKRKTEQGLCLLLQYVPLKFGKLLPVYTASDPRREYTRHSHAVRTSNLTRPVQLHYGPARGSTGAAPLVCHVHRQA